MKPTIVFDEDWDKADVLYDDDGKAVTRANNTVIISRGHESMQDKPEVERLVLEGLGILYQNQALLAKKAQADARYKPFLDLANLFRSKTACEATVIKGIHQFNTMMGTIGQGQGPHITVRINAVTLHVWLSMEKSGVKRELGTDITRFAYRAVQLSARRDGPFVPPTVTFQVYPRERSRSMTYAQFMDKYKAKAKATT